MSRSISYKFDIKVKNINLIYDTLANAHTLTQPHILIFLVNWLK